KRFGFRRLPIADLGQALLFLFFLFRVALVGFALLDVLLFFLLPLLAFALLFFLQRNVRPGWLGRLDLGLRLRLLRRRLGRLGGRFRRLRRRLRRNLFRCRRSIELDPHRFGLGVLPGDAEDQEDDKTEGNANREGGRN